MLMLNYETTMLVLSCERECQIINVLAAHAPVQNCCWNRVPAPGVMAAGRSGWPPQTLRHHLTSSQRGRSTGRGQSLPCQPGT